MAVLEHGHRFPSLRPTGRGAETGARAMTSTVDFETARQFFLEGLNLLEANDFQAAEAKFARSLELIPDRVSTLNNLSAVKIKLRQFAEAEQFALKTIALEENSPEAWSNLGISLTAMERQEEALQACDRALNGNPTYTKVWLTKATTLLKLKRYDEALKACDKALKLEADQHEVLYARSLILKALDRPNEAQENYRKSIELRFAATPVFIAERRATQKADVLILNQKPEDDGTLRSFEDLNVLCLNYPGQLAGRFQDEFHFTYLFSGIEACRSARSRIPQPDFVINNNVNGELVLDEGNLPRLIELVDGFGVPVVNHPAKVIHTTRDMSARLVSDVAGVVVPKTMRFSSAGKTRGDVVHEIEDQFDYPLITRTLSSQMGHGMTKVDSREALVAVLSADFPEKFFVTEFVDSRGGNEFFRKIRAAIVRDEIILVRVDSDSHWSVHARKTDQRVAFYLNNAYLLDEEKRICKDPEARLGQSAIQALRSIRSRIPLDAFGIDFDVDADGRLVFYEANATMNLFTTARQEVQYPQEAEERLRKTFQRYFTSLMTRR